MLHQFLVGFSVFSLVLASQSATASDACVEKKSCNEEFQEARKVCAAVKGAGNGSDNSQVIAKDLQQKKEACYSKAVQNKSVCNSVFEARKAACRAEIAKKEQEMKAAQDKIAEGTERFDIGTKTEKEALLKQDQVEQLVKKPEPTLNEMEKADQIGREASAKFAAAQNIKAQAEADVANGLKRFDQSADARDAFAKILKMLESNHAKENEKFAEFDAETTTLGENTKSILDESQQGPEAPVTRPARAPEKQSGPLPPTTGQGGDGTQANTPPKKQDEGDGGGGMPSFPSFPSNSSSNSSPLSVSEPAQDCSNPSVAASNPVCACRLNPSDSRCANILAADKEKTQGPAKKIKVHDGEEGGGGSFPNANGGSGKEKYRSQTEQFAQGPGGNAGKGVGSGMGNRPGNYGKENPTPAKNRDQTFGSKGSYGGGGSGGGQGFGGVGKPNNRIPATFVGAAVGNPAKNLAGSGGRSTQDLKAQMQAQFGARRGPAGVTGPDGITGPHSDQFKKIRIRYAEALGL